MKEVLTQNEIDSLLNALDSGDLDTELLDVSTKDVKVYDFRRPIKLSKEHMGSLSMIFENYARIVGNILSSQLHINVEVELSSMEQISFDEFMMSIPRSTFIGLFHARPLMGMQILEMSPQLCIQIVELICGGVDSKAKYQLPSSKEGFTDIEMGILEDVVLSILKGFEMTWKDVIEMETRVDQMLTNPQLIQSMSPNEPVILISLLTKISKKKNFINICMPFASFEHILDKISIRNWYDLKKEEVSNDAREIIKDRIISSEVELSVGLGESKITIQDFLDLENGDILTLNSYINEPLKMYVEGKPHFLVKPGLYNRNLAIEVLKYIEEDNR